MGMERSRRVGRVLALLSLAAVAQACSAAPAPADLVFDGPEAAALDAAAVEEARFEVRAQGDGAAAVDELVVLLDGEDVTSDAEVGDRRLTYAPDELADGDRTVTIARADAKDEDAEVEVLHEWHVEVDTVAPEVELTSPEGAVVADEPLTIAGTTEPGATVDAGELTTTADDEGAFELVLDDVPDGTLTVVATDVAGNVADDELTLTTVPSRVEVDELRAVHVSFCAWATPSLREPILQLIDDGLINAVQLDIKDETGKIGPATELEVAHRTGAASADCDIDLDAAVAELHDRDVAVVGRVVAFADPMVARWAWDNGERDWVIQTAGGDMFVGKYAGFTNFSHPEVIAYNIGVAEEAAAAGVDHILWDYLRKPDGPLEQFRFVGLETSPEESLVEFVRRADERLAPYGVQHGASLYGVSADRPTEVSQDVEAMADHLDYAAPMIYPSHWGPGEYDVADPLNQPFDMVEATLEVWQEATDGKRARVLPWLEDSQYPVSLGFPDRARYVREQIRATYGADIHEWVLWDSSVQYTRAAMLQPGD